MFFMWHARGRNESVKISKIKGDIFAARSASEVEEPVGWRESE